MPAAVAEILANRAARIGSQILHRSRIGRRRRHHNRILHGAVVFERLHHLRHRRALLPDRDVNANDVAALLIDDGVERHRGLAGLAVADDQLALPAANRNHRVDGLDAGLHRLFHRLPVDHARRDALNGVVTLGFDRTLAVDRFAQRVNHASDHGLAHRHAHDASRAANLVAFHDAGGFAQQHRAHLIFFQVQSDARNAALELDEFAGHHVLQAVNARDSVAHRNHRAGLGDVDRLIVVLDLLAQQARDFIRPNLSHNSFFKVPGAYWLPSFTRRRSNCPRTLPS